ncbi:MAG: hypothetical protein JNJ61_01410, partial [Anaerolineae bacterium]|nr:hypothetical protein [Anaerolineae bacterium]
MFWLRGAGGRARHCRVPTRASIMNRDGLLFGTPLLYVVAALLLFAGCTPGAQPVIEPTQTLIPPTTTLTPSPIPPTDAATPLPRPGDLVAGTPTPAAEGDTTLDSLAESDPVAAELAALAQRRIAQELNLP